MNISSTSTPAGTLMPALWAQVDSGSDHAWTSNCQLPAVSGVTQAR